MNTIILATDYSPAARHAAVYAAHLAQFLGMDLQLFHAYVIPFSYTDSPVPLLNIEEVQEIARQSMDAEIAHLQKLFPDVTISGNISPGDIIDCLNERIEEGRPELVVMGTSGAGGDSFLWGSMAVKALRTLTVPVLAVPLEAQWTPIDHICFAADYKNIGENFPFKEIKKWVSKLGAKLDVVHVDKPGENVAPDANLQPALSDINPAYHALTDEHIGNAIAGFLEKNKTDWVMVIPKKYGFFENLFHKSRTEILAKASKIPILAIHQD